MLTVRKNNVWFPDFFNDLFDAALAPAKAKTAAPAINVSENDKEYKVEVAAPGMGKDDFDIELNEDNNLVIKLEKKVEKKEEAPEGAQKENNYRYLRREFSYEKYQQTLILPDDVDKENINAVVKHGVLTICLPKEQPKVEPKISRKIDIK
ncbi:MAG: Hsp20/alpha crystallin family protein [Bacteroidaceae bacterium]|nr:Hsp20/alpha crystallin family protein [Bacteroidaceae bacterium]